MRFGQTKYKIKDFFTVNLMVLLRLWVNSETNKILLIDCE